MSGRGKREGAAFFHHGVLAKRYDARAITRELAQGEHFYNADAAFVHVPYKSAGPALKFLTDNAIEAAPNTMRQFAAFFVLVC